MFCRNIDLPEKLFCDNILALKAIFVLRHRNIFHNNFVMRLII